MRRPLFGTGFPRRLLFDDGVVTVFDTNSFTPQENAPQAIAVTLFVWGWQSVVPYGAAANLPQPVVTVDNIAVAQRYHDDFTALQTAQLADVAKPIKLLDRYIVRGDQVIKAANFNANSSVANTVSCFIYGYYEVAGVHVPNFPFRPLQASKPVAPFNAPPALVTVAAPNTTSYTTAHQLYANYLDVLNINTNQGGDTIDAPVDAAAWMRFPNGTKIPLPIALGSGRPLFQASPFEGQPFTPANANDLNIDVGFETSGTLVAPNTVAVAAYGNFRR